MSETTYYHLQHRTDPKAPDYGTEGWEMALGPGGAPMRFDDKSHIKAYAIRYGYDPKHCRLMCVTVSTGYKLLGA